MSDLENDSKKDDYQKILQDSIDYLNKSEDFSHTEFSAREVATKHYVSFPIVSFILLLVLNIMVISLFCFPRFGDGYSAGSADQEMMLKFNDYEESVGPIIKMLSMSKVSTSAGESEFLSRYAELKNELKSQSPNWNLPDTSEFQRNEAGFYWSKR